jgi:2,4-dichlorophenol 6-monooxygenase
MTRFTLLTGVAGQPWVAASEKVGLALGIALETVVIGPGRAVTDLYYDWARLREVDEGGVLLVRPDKHIGWRSMRLPDNPEQALFDALAAILGKAGAA